MKVIKINGHYIKPDGTGWYWKAQQGNKFIMFGDETNEYHLIEEFFKREGYLRNKIDKLQKENEEYLNILLDIKSHIHPFANRIHDGSVMLSLSPELIQKLNELK